jgi:hypothetical protein
VSVGLLRRVAALLLFFFSGAGSCFALTLAELQTMLQAAASELVVPFHEVRESPWLAAPVESRGTLHARPDRLEKHVVTPRRETWLILSDRIEWIGPDGAGSKQILFSGAPAVAVLADALRRVVAGELAALEQNFRVEVHGDARRWTARLLPRSAQIARSLDRLELHGAGALLQVIVIAEPQGDRTTTRLHP